METDTTPKTPPEIEQNIEDWKKSVTSSDALGENAIAGTGIMLDGLRTIRSWTLWRSILMQLHLEMN